MASVAQRQFRAFRPKVSTYWPLLSQLPVSMGVPSRITCGAANAVGSDVTVSGVAGWRAGLPFSMSPLPSPLLLIVSRSGAALTLLTDLSNLSGATRSVGRNESPARAASRVSAFLSSLVAIARDELAG